MARYEHLRALAEQLGKSTPETRDHLKGLAVPVVNGVYDTIHYDALTNNTREVLNLSDTMGLGAVQKVLAPLNLKVVAHDYRGHNELWIAASKKKRVHVKVYFTRRVHSNHAHFTITGFWRKSAPEQYFLFCLEEPCAFVVSKRQLKRYHSTIKTTGSVGPDDRGFSIPKDHWDHPAGVVRAKLHARDHELLLTGKGQLGL